LLSLECAQQYLVSRLERTHQEKIKEYSTVVAKILAFL
jgi:hypothetical protein